MDEAQIKRKCIACNEIKSREDLIKVTFDKKNGNVVVMPNSFCFGRSAYVCKSKDCVEMAFKKDRIYKNLKIKRDDSLKEKIRAVLES